MSSFELVVNRIGWSTQPEALGSLDESLDAFRMRRNARLRSRRPRAYLLSFFGIVDLLAILPFYLSLSQLPSRERVRGL